jgi:hypothetical protein
MIRSWVNNETGRERWRSRIAPSDQDSNAAPSEYKHQRWPLECDVQRTMTDLKRNFLISNFCAGWKRTLWQRVGWQWWHRVPTKRRYPSASPQAFTTQKTNVTFFHRRDNLKYHRHVNTCYDNGRIIGTGILKFRRYWSLNFYASRELLEMYCLVSYSWCSVS